jgi:hypothetical protein
LSWARASALSKVDGLIEKLRLQSISLELISISNAAGSDLRFLIAYRGTAEKDGSEAIVKF